MQAEAEKVAARLEITETLSRNIELERLLDISSGETEDRDARIAELQVGSPRLEKITPSERNPACFHPQNMDAKPVKILDHLPDPG